MPEALRFDFDAPIEQPVFWQGTGLAGHAGWTGARHAARTRGEKVVAYVQLVAHHGPFTDMEVHAITGWPLSSVCSIRNAIIRYAKKHGGPTVVKDSAQIVTWGPDDTTTRTRWRVQR